MQLNQKDFLNKYNITESDFEDTGLNWENLKNIYAHFEKNRDNYFPTAKDIVERLVTIDSVHSVRYRIKDPEHLIEKIIRKKIKNPEREYTIENYAENIDDLIGVRALHLYKSEWKDIGDFIKNNWALKEDPTAYIRKGDADEIQKQYVDKGYVIEEHKYGYRSIHYIIQSSPTKTRYTAELQIRTIFEEGWSEIDHDIRYPYDIDNPILKGYLNMFNRLAGNADEMGTYIKFLQNELTIRENKYKSYYKKKEEEIKELKKKVKELKVDKSLKEEINSGIDNLLTTRNSFTNSGSITNSFQNLSKKDFCESPLQNISQMFSTSGNVAPSYGYYECRKCDECGKPERNLMLPTDSLAILGDEFHLCNSCNRYLCNECWPHKNPFTLPTLSDSFKSYNSEKCPKCAEEDRNRVHND